MKFFKKQIFRKTRSLCFRFLNSFTINLDLLIFIPYPFYINTLDASISKNIYIGNKQYNKKMLAEIFEFVRQRRKIVLLIDVGANIGSNIIPALLLHKCDYGIAIEPDPITYGVLKKNININDLTKKCVLINEGVSSSKQELILQVPKNKRAESFIENNSEFMNYKNTKTLKIQCNTLDFYLWDVRHLLSQSIIIMDIQGWEFEALKGATEILNFNPVLVLEIWPNVLNHRHKIEDLLFILSKFKYFMILNINSSTILELREFEKIWTQNINTNKYFNLIFFN